MNVLGIGGSVHDFSSCLVQDGRIAVAVDDERLTRQKYGMGTVSALGFSARHCLRYAGLSPEDVDLFVANDAVMHTAYALAGDRITLINHHLAHAASAFYPSGFEEAAVMVVDNEGGKVAGPDGVSRSETVTYAVGRDREISVIGRIMGERWTIVQEPCSHPACILRGPAFDNWIGGEYERRMGARPPKKGPFCLADRVLDNSLGGMYGAITRLIGLGCMDAGKTMGLAAFGGPGVYARMRELMALGPDGMIRVRLDPSFVDWCQRAVAGEGDDWYGLRADLAWAAQRMLEEALLHAARYLRERTGLRALCLAGGCALNCQANGVLSRSGVFDEIFVQPASADNGTAVGAALYGYHVLGKASRDPSRAMDHAFWGTVYDGDSVTAALESCPGVIWRREPDVCGCVARAVAGGAIVAWFRGGGEYGPRALGHRTILADPRRPEMKHVLNERVKHREPFRPFAPAVPLERAGEWFDLNHPSPFMLFAVPVLRPHDIPAVVHTDGTARVQTVDRATDPEFHRVLELFGELTGVPVMLNTSFNIKGKPIVESPRDAVQTFFESGIDALCLDDLWVTKR